MERKKWKIIGNIFVLSIPLYIREKILGIPDQITIIQMIIAVCVVPSHAFRRFILIIPGLAFLCIFYIGTQLSYRLISPFAPFCPLYIPAFNFFSSFSFFGLLLHNTPHVLLEWCSTHTSHKFDIICPQSTAAQVFSMVFPFQQILLRSYIAAYLSTILILLVLFRLNCRFVFSYNMVFRRYQVVPCTRI